jgi:hypothetical protein
VKCVSSAGLLPQHLSGAATAGHPTSPHAFQSQSKPHHSRLVTTCPYAKNFKLMWCLQVSWFACQVSNAKQTPRKVRQYMNPKCVCLPEKGSSKTLSWVPQPPRQCCTSAPDPGPAQSTFLFFLGPIAASAVRLASRCRICASSCCCIFELEREQQSFLTPFFTYCKSKSDIQTSSTFWIFLNRNFLNVLTLFLTVSIFCHHENLNFFF